MHLNSPSRTLCPVQPLLQVHIEPLVARVEIDACESHGEDKRVGADAMMRGIFLLDASGGRSYRLFLKRCDDSGGKNAHKQENEYDGGHSTS